MGRITTTVFLLLFLALAGFSFSHPERLEWCFVHLSYPLLLTLLGLAGWQLRRYRQILVRQFSGILPWLILAILLTLLILSSTPPRQRVVSDETMPLSLSWQLMRDGTVRTPTHGVVRHGVMDTLEYSVADRPLLQAVLLSLFHRLAGYRPEHAFLLNGLLLVLFLTLTGVIASRASGGAAGGIALLGLVLAQPLFILAATSGGNDLLHLSLLLLSFYLVHRLIIHPGSGRLLDLLLVLSLLAHVRPESALFLGVIPGSLLVIPRLRTVLWSNRSWLSVLPGFILPRIWQQLLYGHTYSRAFQHSAQPAEFSPAILLANLGHLLRGLLDPGFILPFAPLVLLITVLGGLAWFYPPVRKRDVSFPAGTVIGISAIVIHLVLVLSYWGGSPRHPISIRYCLPLSAGISLFCWLVWNRLRVPRDLLAAGALCLTLLYLPVGTEGRFSGSESWIRKFQAVHHWLQRESPDGLLIIDRHPDRYTALEMGAVSYSYWHSHRARLLDQLRSGSLRKILVIQDSLQGYGDPIADCRLDGIKLYPLLRQPVSDELTVTISEILP